MDMTKDKILIEKLARRLWSIVAWDRGINPTMSGKPTTYDQGDSSTRAHCKTLSMFAIEEFEIY